MGHLGGRWHCRYVTCILQLNCLCGWQEVSKLYGGRPCRFTAQIFHLRYATQVVKRELLRRVKGYVVECRVHQTSVHGRPLLSFNPYFLKGSFAFDKTFATHQDAFFDCVLDRDRWVGNSCIRIVRSRSVIWLGRVRSGMHEGDEKYLPAALSQPVHRMVTYRCDDTRYNFDLLITST